MLPISVAVAALAIQPAAATDPRPLQPPGAWIADSDYPEAAIRREASGTVRFRLQVGADGAPTACAVVQPVDPDLDAATCNIFMTRGHFAPARDRSGTAVAGTYSGGLRWVLPPAEPPPLVPLHRADLLRLDDQGNLTCLTGIDGEPREQSRTEACGFLSSSGGEAALRARGRPGDLILIFVLTPEGMTPAPGNEEAGGDLVYEDRASLVIAPDGTLSECRPDNAHVVRSALPIRFPPACYALGRRITTAATNQEPRRASVAIRAYTRDSAARPRP